MKSTMRPAAAAAGFLALTLAATPAFAQYRDVQRGGPPTQDTPYILIATFHSPDRKLAVEASDEVRKRIASEHAARELFVVPKQNINNTLEASGYRPDSALNASDLMELSKQLHGEYVLDAVATPIDGGRVRITPKILMRTGQQTLTQPLPAVEGKDAGDAAKAVEKELSDALKGMDAYKKCTNALRANKYDEAITEAQKGIQAYGNSSLNRLCIMSAYTYNKAPADSVISIANQILAIDSTSILALNNAAQAYNEKGDKDKAIEYNLRIYRADPTNTTIVPAIIAQLAQSGAPDKAIPIIDTLLINNPGDPEMLRTKWLLLLNAKRYKDAIAAGNVYVKAVPDSATLDFFQRQIGAAQSDSNQAAVQELAAKAAQKFQKEISFPLLLAQAANKAGQLQQSLEWALKAAAIDPKNTNAWQFAIAAANGMNQPDSSAAYAQRAIAAGADKTTLATSLLGPTSDLVKKAQASKSREDWLAALKSAQAVDAIAASPESKFFIGVSSFSAAADIVSEIQPLTKSTKKADQAQACTLAKQADDLFALTSINMPAGGAVDKNVAGQLLSAVPQYTDFTGQVKKAFCK